jgi:excinuclease UvrABC nuclease subunit
MDRWTSPYKGNKTTKRFTYKKPGCYLIKNKTTGFITYIGMSSVNVYKALYRHFQQWNDKPWRVTYHDYDNYLIRVIICQNRQHAAITERRLIKWFKPTDNHEYYEDWEYTTNVPEYLEKQELVECPY